LLLGKRSAYGWSRWVGLASPAVALVTVLLARAVWATAIQRYRSTGT
jgi:ABC-type uncharacterized transport system permease subunit